MLSTLKNKWHFDIASGHYHRINEADESQESSQPEEEKEKPEEDNKKSSSYKPVDSDDKILDILNKIQSEEKDYHDKKKNVNDQILARKKIIADSIKNGDSLANSSYDPTETDSGVLSLENKLNDIERNHYNLLNSLKQQLIARKQELAAIKEALEAKSFIEGGWGILNESQLEKSKIYIPSDYIAPEKPIHSLPSFKRIMSKAHDLVYGKDKKGYFVCCIDQDDIDLLFDVLADSGYEREEVASWLITVLSDRRKFF